MAATRYERRLDAAAADEGMNESGGRALAAAFAAAARAAARAAAAPADGDARARALRTVAAGVVGPMLAGYVLWILADARARGIGRLYFLARDGQVLHALARRLGSVAAPEIALAYLPASRQIWNRAISDSRDHHWLWYGGHAGTSVAGLLRRLAVPGDGPEGQAVADGLAGLGLPRETWDRPLGEAEAGRLRAWLAGPDFAAAAAPARAANRRRLVAHLAQEGLVDPAAPSAAPSGGRPAAIVDLGWIGSLHDALARLLAEEGAPPVDCYLFGIEAVKDATFLDRRRGFFFDHNRGQGADVLPRRDDQRAFLEVFCAADHGTVTGLAAMPDGGIAAETDPAWAGPVAAWGLGTVRATLDAFAGALAAELAGPPSAGAVLALRPVIGDLLRSFWLDPAPAEARAWGSFPFNLGEGHGSFTAALATPYRVADLRRVAKGGKALKKHEHFWVEGGIAATPQPLRTLISTARRLRRARRPAPR